VPARARRAPTRVLPNASESGHAEHRALRGDDRCQFLAGRCAAHGLAGDGVDRDELVVRRGPRGVADDDEREPSAAAEIAVLAFYDPSGQYATGGGWIWDPAGGHGNFGFNARFNKQGKAQGQMVYVYRGLYNGVLADFVIKSNALNSLVFYNNGSPCPTNTQCSATLTGKASIQINRASDGVLLYGEGNDTFTATAFDGLKVSPSPTLDTFALTVYNNNAVLYKNVVPAVQLNGGNVVVHGP
jgi:hypothetical protein